VEEGVRGMSVSDDPGNLPDEATKIAAHCDRVLDFARDTVEGIPVPGQSQGPSSASAREPNTHS
jgi:hypothetical protein